MLLAIEVGNSNTVFGLYRLVEGPAGEQPGLVATLRVTTPENSTADEFGLQMRSLFERRGVGLAEVTGIAISSVVPQLDPLLRNFCDLYFKMKPLFIEPGVKTGLPVLTDNPTEVGADRIMNSVAAYDRFKGPCIVVDMGTATNFDVVSAKGEFLGGAIAPGLGIAADALFSRAARLPRIEVKKPAKVIGTNTVDNIQIGLYYGYIGLVDGILKQMLAEMPPETKVVGTGGLMRLIASGSKYVREVDEMLTLNGLRIVYERHVERMRRRG